MNNKSLLLIIAAQSTVMLGLLYTLWEKISNNFVINGNTAIFLATFSVASLVLSFVLQTKKTYTYKTGVRKDGTVKWFSPNKGFGFIEQDNGQDLFVHQSEIKLSGFRYLNKDDRVEYDIGLGKKGPVAQNVVRIKEAENEWEQVPEEEPISRAS